VPAAPLFLRDLTAVALGSLDPPPGAGAGTGPRRAAARHRLPDAGCPDEEAAIRMQPLTPPFGELLETLRRRRPLVHHLTNMVVANATANVTLALGASPIMAAAAEEVEQVAARADAVVLNLGTLSPAAVDAMVAAGRAANAAGRPVILDPVRYGFTELRTRSAERILAEVRVAVIRGNQAEIALLAGTDA